MKQTLFLAVATALAGSGVLVEASPGSPSAEPSAGAFAAASAESRDEKAIRRAFEDVLDRKPSRRELDHYLDLMEDDDWSERDVRDDLREKQRSERGRRHEDPERIIRRAYEDILDREPDRDGLRLYRSRMIDDDWTEEDVREALRKSPEYREKSRMTPAKAQQIVRDAYLSVLGREPDAGSRGYVNRVLKDKWTEEDVARELRKSAEYRQKHR